jgi:hypothetical protein
MLSPKTILFKNACPSMPDRRFAKNPEIES